MFQVLVVLTLSGVFAPITIASQEGSPTDPRRQIGAEPQGPLAPEQDVPFFSPSHPISYELASYYLDDTTLRAKRAEGAKLIVIARLGERERSSSLTKRRLKSVWSYLVYEKRIPAAAVVMAEGERAAGYGRIELYVGGKLLYSLLQPWNANMLDGAPG